MAARILGSHLVPDAQARVRGAVIQDPQALRQSRRALPAPGGRLGRMLGGVVIVLGEILRRAGGGLDGSDRQHRLHPHVHVVIDLRRMIRAVMTMVVIGVALRRKPIAQFAGRLVLVAIGITAIGPAFRGMA